MKLAWTISKACQLSMGKVREACGESGLRVVQTHEEQAIATEEEEPEEEEEGEVEEVEVEEEVEEEEEEEEEAEMQNDDAITPPQRLYFILEGFISDAVKYMAKLDTAPPGEEQPPPPDFAKNRFMFVFVRPGLQT